MLRKARTYSKQRPIRSKVTEAVCMFDNVARPSSPLIFSAPSSSLYDEAEGFHQDIGTSQDTASSQDTVSSQDTASSQDIGTSQDTASSQDIGASQDTANSQDTVTSSQALSSQATCTSEEDTFATLPSEYGKNSSCGTVARNNMKTEQHPCKSMDTHGRRIYGAGSGHLPRYRPVKSPRISSKRYINLSPEVCAMFPSKKTKYGRFPSDIAGKMSLWGCDTDGSTTAGSDIHGEMTADTGLTKKSSHCISRPTSSTYTDSSYTYVEMTVESGRDYDSPCERLRRDVIIHREEPEVIELLSPAEKALQTEKEIDDVLLMDWNELPPLPSRQRLNSTLLEHGRAKDLHDCVEPSNISAIEDLEGFDEEEELEPEIFINVPPVMEPMERGDLDHDENNNVQMIQEKTPNSKPKAENRRAFKLRPKASDKHGKLKPMSSTLIFPDTGKPSPQLITGDELSTIPAQSRLLHCVETGKLDPKSSTLIFPKTGKDSPQLVIGDELSTIPAESGGHLHLETNDSFTECFNHQKHEILNTAARTPVKSSEPSTMLGLAPDFGLAQHIIKKRSAGTRDDPKVTSTPIHGNSPPQAMMELSSIGSDNSPDDLHINVSVVVNSNEIIAMDTDEEEDMATAMRIIQSKPGEKLDCEETVPQRGPTKTSSPSSRTNALEQIVFKIPDPVYSPYTQYMKAQQRKLQQSKVSGNGSDRAKVKLCSITRMLDKYPNYPGPRKVKVRRSNPLLHTAPPDFLETIGEENCARKKSQLWSSSYHIHACVMPVGQSQKI